MAVLKATLPGQVPGQGIRAAKLGVLLGQGAGASVLMVGSCPPGWDDYEALFRLDRVPTARADTAALEGRTFDLILWHPTPPELTRGLLEHTRLLAPLLREHGSLVILAVDPFQRRDHWRRPVRLLASLAVRAQLRQLPRGAGFPRIHAFAAIPSLSFAESFIRHDAAGPAHLLTPCDRLLILSDAAGGTSSLLDELGQRLARPGEVTLERFELRPRGALVLILGAPSGTRFVCRITTSQEAEAMVGRNSRWAGQLRSDTGLAEWARERIPEQVGTWTLHHGTTHVESCVPGTIAWRLASRPAMERRMAADLLTFHRHLQEATVEHTLADADTAAGLLQVQSYEWVDSELLGALQTLASRLGSRIIGRDLVTAVAHGDYGYGNAIVAAGTGALQGIIDWDHADRDLAGVDLVNFVVQRERIKHGLPFLKAAQLLAQRIRSGVPIASPQIDQELARLSVPRGVLYPWTLFRMVQQATRYPALFSASRDAALGVTLLALGLLDDA